MRIRQASMSLAAALALTPIGLSAHHGAGLFDGEKTVTVTGIVTEFQFVNPHVLVYVAVPDDAGDVRWGGELTSPNRLARMGGPVGWHKNILQPGDEITMAGHPARNGAPAMNITKIVTADGVVLIGE